MPSPAEPRSPPDFTDPMPLTTSALEQLDAQVRMAEADHGENRFIDTSRSKHADVPISNIVNPNSPTQMLNNKTPANLEPEISKDSHSSPPASHHNVSSSSSSLHTPISPQYSHHLPSPPLPLLMTDYIVDGTIYRHPETLNTLITIGPTPDKGLAVFALCDLAPHTLLLSERPLVALNDDGARVDPLDALVNALPPPLKRAYRSLHGFSASSSNTSAKARPRESLNRRVLYSNGFAIERTTTAVFEVASRINHSCVPNARFRWDEEAGRMDYYVVRKVLKGEEVCIDYGHTKGRLLKYYGFECACGGCTEWGSVTSSGGTEVVEEKAQGQGKEEEGGEEVRLVQADGLWRPVEVAEIAAAVKEDKENAMGCSKGVEQDKQFLPEPQQV